MSDKISEKFHPIPSTIANQRRISIRNIIIYLETKFRPNRKICVFGGHFCTLTTSQEMRQYYYFAMMMTIE